MDESESDPAPVSVSVWCHVCGDTTSATRNAQGEWECVLCGGTFVEELDQGVEEFLGQGAEGEEQGEGEGEREGEEQGEREGEEQGEGEREGGESLPSHSHSHSHSFSTSFSVDSNGPADPVATAVLSQVLSLSSLSLPNAGGAMRPTPLFFSGRPVGVLFAQAVAVPVSLPVTGSGTAAAAAAPLLSLLSSLSQQSDSSGSGSGSGSDGDALSNAQFEQFLHHVLVNETAQGGAPPASDALIASLHSETSSKERPIPGQCAISQEPFNEGDEVLSLPCGHRFKREPVTQWLRLHRTCPECRVDVAAHTQQP